MLKKKKGRKREPLQLPFDFERKAMRMPGVNIIGRLLRQRRAALFIFGPRPEYC